jgi:hypothetical protein
MVACLWQIDARLGSSHRTGYDNNRKSVCHNHLRLLDADPDTYSTYATIPHTSHRLPSTRRIPHESHNFLSELSCCCVCDDFRWGFRVFRACYPPTCSGANFERAMEVSDAYMRFGCLVGFDEFVRDAGGNDSAEQELAGRLRNDIVQDRSLLESASMGYVRGLAKDWIAARGASISESTRYRFFIVIDNEVVRQLLRFPMPIPDYLDEWLSCSIEVLDVGYDAGSERSPCFPRGPENRGQF